MSTHKQRSRGKERFWRSRVRRWRKSGLSVRAFCADEGLSEPSFYAWRRILAERDTERDAASDAASDRTATAFVPVRVVTTEPVAPSANAAESVGATAALELVLSGDRRLRIGPGFDGPTLQRLLAFLEGGRP
jgi:hypothetical protein